MNEIKFFTATIKGQVVVIEKRPQALPVVRFFDRRWGETVPIPTLLNMIDGHKLTLVRQVRSHEEAGDIVAAIKEISDDFHGGDSVAKRFKRLGEKLGLSDQTLQKLERQINSRNPAQGSEKTRPQEDDRGNPTKAGGGVAMKKVAGRGWHTPDANSVRRCAEIVKNWLAASSGVVDRESKFNPLHAVILQATNRSPLPAVESKEDAMPCASLLITADVSGSCSAFSAGAAAIAEALAKELAGTIDVFYCENINGVIHSTKSFDFVLYMGDGDVFQNLSSEIGRSWIVLDNHACNFAKPAARREKMNGADVAVVTHVRVSTIEGILDGLLAARRVL